MISKYKWGREYKEIPKSVEGTVLKLPVSNGEIQGFTHQKYFHSHFMFPVSSLDNNKIRGFRPLNTFTALPVPKFSLLHLPNNLLGWKRKKYNPSDCFWKVFLKWNTLSLFSLGCFDVGDSGLKSIHCGTSCMFPTGTISFCGSSVVICEELKRVRILGRIAGGHCTGPCVINVGGCRIVHTSLDSV